MKACIFDLDGTLTDMELPPITADECESFVGNGARVLMECSLRAAGEENKDRLEEAMERYGRIFDANCTYHVTPYEGVEEMLRGLKEKGIRLGVLSNKPHRQTVKVVREIFGENVFDFAQGQQEQVPRKPDPAGVLRLLEEMLVTRDECLYVGDSEVDIQTGRNAGVRTISVTWGFRTREVLVAAGAGTIIDRPEELLRLV